MVQFSRRLHNEQKDEWGTQYVSYDRLKLVLKSVSLGDAEPAQALFRAELEAEVAKIVSFYSDVESGLLQRVQRLCQRRAVLAAEGADYSHKQFTAASDLHTEFCTLCVDMTELLAFVELNVTGVRKILKKYDKRHQTDLTSVFLAVRRGGGSESMALGGDAAVCLASIGSQRLQPTIATIEREMMLVQQLTDPFRTWMPGAELTALRRAAVSVRESSRFLDRTVSFISLQAMLPSAPAPGIATSLSMPSLLLNLFSTLLYMTNYNVALPTATEYANVVGLRRTMAGAVLAAMPIAACASSVAYSKWSNFTFHQPLLASASLLVFGNVLYALAYDAKSVTLLTTGRFICGLGGCRAVNRRYIADHVPLRHRTAASAAFVAFGAFGMAVGPGLSAALAHANSVVQIPWFGGSVTVNAMTLPAWVMALTWVGYFLVCVALFEEPDDSSARRGLLNRLLFKSGRRSPATPSGDKTEGDGGEFNNAAGSGGTISVCEPRYAPSDEASALLAKTSTHGAYGSVALRPAISLYQIAPNRVVSSGGDKSSGDGKVACLVALLFCIGSLKFEQEAFLTSSPLLTSEFFGWDFANAGTFLAVLGLCVLPANAFMGFVSSRISDRSALLWSQLAISAGIASLFALGKGGGFGIGGSTRYVVAGVVAFVSEQLCEGVAYSLLSKKMPRSLASGTFNSGLLSTEVGTICRALGNALVAVAGILAPSEQGVNPARLQNAIISPILVVAIGSIAASAFVWNRLDG